MMLLKTKKKNSRALKMKSSRVKTALRKLLRASSFLARQVASKLTVPAKLKLVQFNHENRINAQALECGKLHL